jgi:hypothetical protein
MARMRLTLAIRLRIEIDDLVISHQAFAPELPAVLLGIPGLALPDTTRCPPPFGAEVLILRLG